MSAESISTLDLMVDLIEKSFGSITISASKWRRDRPKSHDNKPLPSQKLFPNRSYFYDRQQAALRKSSPSRAINALCAAHIERLYRLALTTDTRFDRFQVSASLNIILSRAAKYSLNDYCMIRGKSHAANTEAAEMQLRLLKELLDLAQDEESVDSREYLERVLELIKDSPAQQTVANNRKIDLSQLNTVTFLSDSVSQVDFRRLILQTKETMTIAQMHGNEWLAANESALESRMSAGHLEIRIVTASTQSAFLAPYAQLKSSKKTKSESQEDARKKIEWVTQTWRDLFERAKNNGAKNLSIAFYRHRKPPLYGVHVFDDLLILTPTRISANNNNRFPAFAFRNTGDKDSPYEHFSSEIKELIRSCTEKEGPFTTATGDSDRPRTRDFLEGVLTTCFGSVETTSTTWRASELLQADYTKHFEQRLEAAPDAPFDNKTANMLVQAVSDGLRNKTEISSTEFSRRLADFLGDTCNIPLNNFALTSHDTKLQQHIKRQCLINALSIVVTASINAKDIDLPKLELNLELG